MRLLVTPTVARLRGNAPLLVVLFLACLVFALFVLVRSSPKRWSFIILPTFFALVAGSCAALMFVGGAKLDRRRDPGWIKTTAVLALVTGPLLLLFGIGLFGLPFVPMREGPRIYVISIEAHTVISFAIIGLGILTLTMGFKTLHTLKCPELVEVFRRQ